VAIGKQVKCRASCYWPRTDQGTSGCEP